MDTILIIDDEAAARDSIAVYLSDSGFNLLEAENGEQGLAILQAEKPDLVLCDLRIPGMDGLEVLRTIREQMPDVAVIVVSGVGMVSDVVEALRLGAADYLVKPIVDLEVLEYSVRQALDRQHLRKENKSYRDELETTNRTLRNSLRLLEEDQAAGRTVQLKLLPAPVFQHLDCTFTHHIVPSLYLSGDFVDYFKINENILAFYIADVSGHGASSAFITVLIDALVKRFRQQLEENPRIPAPTELLSYLNKELFSMKLGKYATMFCGIFNTQQHELHYSTAGHFPAPVLIAKDTAYYLSGTGLAVGLLEGASYENKILSLPHSFSLAMFSDGILEIIPCQSLADKEQYLLMMLQNEACDLHSLRRVLKLDEVRDPPDDMTMMLLTRKLTT